MNDWPAVFLGVIAVSTLLMALIQVGAIIATLRVAREAQQALASIRQEVRPIITKTSALVEEASKTVTLATAQVQKVDRLVTDLSQRVEETSAVVQHAIVAPAREGIAIVAAIKAALGAFRGMTHPGRPGRHAEEEDPLFIG